MPNKPKRNEFMSLEVMITSSMIQYRCYMVTGVKLSTETIKKVRRGDRSQKTPTGKLIMNTISDIKYFLSNEKQ